MKKSTILSFIVVSTLVGGCAPDIVTSKPYTADGIEFGSAKGVGYFLPKALVSLEVERKKGVVTVKAKDPIYMPDTDHLYFLEYDHDVFFDDEVTIQVGSNGLLSSIETKSKDQSGEFVKKIVELATEVAKIAAVSGDGKEKDFKIVDSFDPLDDKDRSRFERKLSRALGTRIADVDVSPMFQEAKFEKFPKKCTSGVCARTALPYQVTLSILPKSANSDSDTLAWSFGAHLPQQAPVIGIPLTRSSFVKNEAELTFSNGMLTKLNYVEPSEAVGFMQIPIDVAKAIVSIPSAVLDFKVTNLEKDKKLLKEQKGLIDAQNELIKAQQEQLEDGD